MGRAPCCDKANVKKGPWSPEEDQKLKSYIEKHGTVGNWIALPHQIGLKRCGKSCRLRWLNYLRPNIKHGGFSEEEDNIICCLYNTIGSRWSIIAAQLPGRTDNDIKNYWNTRLKKKLLGKQRNEQQNRKIKSLNQNLKTENDAISNQNTNWPELPLLAHSLPFLNQERPFNTDHESIKKLLIKLGGRINYNYDQAQFANGNYYHHLSSSSSSSMEVFNGSVQFEETQCNIDCSSGFQMLQGHTIFKEESEQMACGNNTAQRLDGLEFLYSDDMFSDGLGSSGEMGSLIYPSIVASNC